MAAGQRLKLTFLDFDVEQDDGYCYDWVEVRYRGVRQKFCGQEIPGPFVSSTNTMDVSFHSDEMINFKGFLAEYEADRSASNNSEGRRSALNVGRNKSVKATLHR